MFLRRWEGKRRCRFPPFTFRETNDSQFLLKVVIGPDLDLNKDEVEMVVLKRLWPCPAGTDLAGGGLGAVPFRGNTYLDVSKNFQYNFIRKLGPIAQG